MCEEYIFFLIFGNRGKSQLVFYVSLLELDNHPEEVKSKDGLACGLINKTKSYS